MKENTKTHMTDRSRTSDIDRLSEAVQSLRKSLECTICLDFIKDPIKTRCGHSFCRACIWEVLQIKKPACPLCQKGLTRRNISKDDHMQTCIEKFIKLISAIQADSKIDILSHLKHPRDTRESCSHTDASGSNRSTGKRRPSNRPAVSARQVSANSDRQTDKASTSRGTAIDRDNSRDDTNLPNQLTVTDSSAVYPLSAEHDDSYCKPDIKVRTWLRSFSGESAADLETVDETTEGEATHSLIPDDNSKSSSGMRLVKSKNRRTSRGRKRKVGSECFDEDNTSRPDTKSSEKKDLSASGLKYDKIHARTRKKDNRKDEEEKKSSVDESAIDASDRANLDVSSANWSRVIEFGKEMRDKKKTVKKLNVRTEKNKPKIVESVVLSPRSMIDLVKLSGNTDVRFTCETNVCHSLIDERDREQNAADTSPRVSTPLKRSKKVKDTANSSTSDHSVLETSFITLEENRKVRITKLNNDQVSEILGFGVTEGEEDSRNRRRMTAASSTTSRTPKRLIALTPEKLNERDRKTPIIDSGSVSYLPAGNRSLGAQEKDSEAQRTSGEIDFPPMRTPKKSRLSLKRKLASSDDKSAADSPLLDRFSLTDKSSAGEHEKDADDREGVNSPKARDTEVSDRLARDRARRNVNMRIDEDHQSRTDRSRTLAASSLRSRDDGDRGIARRDEKLVSDFTGRSRKSRELETPGHDSRVKFVQLGSMKRRRQTKYYYLGKMSRERSLAAEIQDVSVYNMQRSISKSEMIKRVADTPRGLATSPSDDSQASVVATEATRYLAKSLNRAAAENPMLPAAISTYSFAAISTPRRDIDRRTRRSSTDVNARTNELIEDKENARSSKMPCEDVDEGKAFREISRVSSSRSPVRLLSPNEDSQLKFLETDSPMNERAFKRNENSTQRRPEHEKAIARDYFFQKGQSPLAASTSKKRESSSENFDKKRKRCVANKEMFKDESDDDLSDDPADDDPRPSANSRDGRDKSSKDAKSDANKRRCLSSVNEDIEVISDSDVRKAPVKKFRRIITIPSPSTESESHCTPIKCSGRDDHHDRPSRTSVADEFTAQGPGDKQVDQEKRIRNILQNWNREHNEMISRDNTEIISKRNTPSGVETTTRVPPEEESATRQSSSVTENALEKRSANRKDCSMKESQMFESNSIFHSDNLDYIMEETGIGASDKLANSSNNDIINRVLRIDRNNSDARQSQIAAASRSDGTSQRGKTAGGGDYLLQDNFDEIIASVDLSQRMILRGTPSGRSPDRTPAREKTSNCPAMTDEPRGATQETAPVIPASTNDIFEHSGSHSDRNAEGRPFGASGNSDKENVAHGRKEYAIDGDPGGKIRREASLDRGDGTWIDAERHRVGDDSAQNRNPSGDQSRNSQNDSIMNVTRDQLRLQIFEEDLFGVAPSGSPTKAANVTSREDDLYREASTPKREERGDLRDKNMSPREHADENDVVENTPESKIKKSGSRNIATADSRRNIAISFLTPKSTDWTPVSTPKTPIVEKIPFCQSTPRETSDPIVAGCLNVRTVEIRKTELATHGVVLPATRQATSKTLEDNRPDGETPCIVCSSLTITQTKTVKDFVAKYRMKFADRFDPKIVTHVIVNTTGKENAAKSTLKYLQGVAHRKWIVSYRWVEDCIKKQKILDEAPYEATTFYDDIFPAPRNSRLRERDLFEGFVFVCIGPYDNVTPAEYQDLLLATGATVVDSLKDLDKKEGLKGILIQDGVHDNKVIENWYRTAKAAPILVDWIVDCIGRYKLLKLASYVQYLSPQDYYALGYPRDLIEDEECSDDDLLIIK